MGREIIFVCPICKAIMAWDIWVGEDEYTDITNCYEFRNEKGLYFWDCPECRNSIDGNEIWMRHADTLSEDRIIRFKKIVYNIIKRGEVII